MFMIYQNQFPALINNCTINQFSEWPSEVLISMALKDLQNWGTTLGLSQHINSLTQILYSMHYQMEIYTKQLKNSPIYITPFYFIQLLKSYIHLQRKQQKTLPLQIKKFQSGVSLIKDTQREIQKIRQKILEYQPIAQEQYKINEQLKQELKQKNFEIQNLSYDLTKDTQKADEKRQIIFLDKEKYVKESDDQKKLLQKCRDAVQNIDKNQINTMKSYIQPPNLIKMVMEATCLLFGYEETWEDAKRFLLNDMQFLQKLQNFDVQGKHLNFEKLRETYFKNSDWIRQKILFQSECSAQIFDWINTIDQLQLIFTVSVQKENLLQDTVSALSTIEDDYNSKNEILKRITKEFQHLSHELKESTIKSEQIEKQTNAAQKQLIRAERLINMLIREERRWSHNLQDLQDQMSVLIGDILLCSGLIVYLASFKFDQRTMILQEWQNLITNRNIPFDKKFQIVKQTFNNRVMSSESQVMDWLHNGLPNDDKSVQNAIIIQHSQKWPLIIDPQGQANKWIRQQEADNKLCFGDQNQSKFIKILENCAQFGQPYLLENIQLQISPLLDNLLLKNSYRKGQFLLVKIGEQEVQLHSDFKLFMTTKLPNPHYFPEILRKVFYLLKVNLIDFSVSQIGFEEQLLSEIVMYERADLESKRKEQIIELLINYKKISELEDQILQEIQEQSGKILVFNIIQESDIVILSIQNIQNIYDLVQEEIRNSTKIKNEINNAREQYRPVAQRGTIIFFSIQDLMQIEYMYQWTLDFFLIQYKYVLKQTDPHQTIQNRIQNIIQNLTEHFYQLISRGLFEKDKLLFSFLISSRIYLECDLNQNKLWRFFLLGPPPVALQVNETHPIFLTESQWNSLSYLFTLDPLYDEVKQNFLSLQSGYKIILSTKDPHQIEMAVKISKFLHLLILKCLRPEKLISCIMPTLNYFPKEIDILQTYQHSSNKKPIVFIISSGADPLQFYQKFEQLIGKQGVLLSMGQGQNLKAIQLVIKARKDGTWIYLQNCHLNLGWFDEFRKIDGAIHQDFRLFISTKKTLQFPLWLLHESITITMEPPLGFKQNIQQLYSNINIQEYALQNQNYKKLLFRLANFHTLITQRKKYGALGWNNDYEWMINDFESSQLIIKQIKYLQVVFDYQQKQSNLLIIQLKNLIEYNEEIEIQAIKVLISECIYGGRVNDEKDFRLIRVIFKSQLEILEEIDEQYEIQNIKIKIQQISDNDVPEIYGLHSNSQIQFEKSQSNYLILNLKQISNDILENVEIKEKTQILTQISIFLKNYIQKPIDYLPRKNLTALLIFRNQEVQKFNNLIFVIYQSLIQIQQCNNGLINMTKELLKTDQQIIKNEVPQQWQRVSYLSEKPLASWLEDFKERINFLKHWQNENIKAYFLSSFYYPEGFITALKQMFSRKKKLPIDIIQFEFKIQKFDYEPQMIENGVNIYSIYIQGCIINPISLMLIEYIDKNNFQKLPIISIIPNINQENQENIYACPLYKTISRRGEQLSTGLNSNFIFYIYLQTQENSEKWIKAGVAAFCQSDD